MPINVIPNYHKHELRWGFGYYCDSLDKAGWPHVSKLLITILLIIHLSVYADACTPLHFSSYVANDLVVLFQPPCTSTDTFIDLVYLYQCLQLEALQ